MNNEMEILLAWLTHLIEHLKLYGIREYSKDGLTNIYDAN